MSLVSHLHISVSYFFLLNILLYDQLVNKVNSIAYLLLISQSDY